MKNASKTKNFNSKLQEFAKQQGITEDLRALLTQHS